MGTLNTTFNPGCIEVVVGTMYSGKSKEILERGMRAEQYGDVPTYYFKPKIDTRDENIASRNGLSAEAHLIEKGEEILNIMKNVPEPSVILIDESQFLDETLLYAIQILKIRDHNIVLAGLDKDFRGQPFSIMPQLMALSDSAIRKIYPVCSIDGCWDDGILPQRLRNGKPDSALSETVIIEGSKDDISYQPVCGEHHIVPDLEEYLKNHIKQVEKPIIQ